MRIDLYSVCWNDADMLGFFFRHYDRLVQRYIFFDNGSTDRSLELLNANPKVEVRSVAFDENPDSLLLSAMPLAESCWKESRGVSDWVICTDIDEHLYHPDLHAYLEIAADSGVTIVPALGYQMLSEAFPDERQWLCQDLTMGAPFLPMNKLSIFSPNEIDAVNFAPGRHTATPTGNVIAPDRDELLLLHYKYLNFEKTYKRAEQLSARLRKTDVAHGWGHRWRWSREELLASWEEFKGQLVDVSRPDLVPWQSHPAPRWWEKYRKSASRAA